MARYEFSQGSSNKFWEIKVSGKSFSTTYGKVGTTGQTKTKEFASAAEAKKASEKLIAQKVKKGYAPAKASKAKKAAPAKKAKAPAKKAPAKKAKAPAKKAKAPAKKEAAKGSPATPGARYFEFSDGKSNKFWEVLLDGGTLTTRHGKIGTDGRSTAKKLTPAAAKKERDKLVAQKTKKGYVEISASGEPIKKVVEARNPKLEKAILADPTDEAAFAVFADWLQEQGDPRGELVSLMLNGKDKRAKTFMKKHAEQFLGPLEEHQVVRDKGYNNASSHLRDRAQEKAWQKTHEQAFLWRNGFIHRVRLSHDYYSYEDWDGKTSDVLEAVIAHPSGRFAVEFAFQSNGDPNESSLQSLIDVLGKKAPLSTRKITFGDNVDQISWHHTGNLAKLWKGVPNLETLEIETGHFDVGKMVAPKLERAIFITGGMNKKCGANIAKATMPNIRHLEIYYGDDNYGGNCSVKEVLPLLDRTDLKKLEVLGLKNSMFANDIAKALAGAKVLKTVKKLDLSLGTMTDEGAQALVAAKKSLKHLECLDLSDNFLTKDGIAAVKGLCKNVITSGQQEPYDWGDDELHYYVSVAE